MKQKFFRKPVPNDITHDEVLRLAKSYGCNVRTGGNHQTKIVHVPSGTVIPIPHHGNVVGEAYIKELKILFEAIEEEENDR